MTRYYHYDNIIIILFLCFLTLVLHSNSQTKTNQSEKNILLEFNHLWGNPKELQTWNLSSSHCSWLGISCSNGFVTGISLKSVNITKQIQVPQIICELKHLRLIELVGIKLFVEFPTVLYNCTNLEILNLSWDQLHGPLPNDLHQMLSLTHLDLTGNFFSGTIPPAVGQLSKLQVLLLGLNNFNGSIAKLGSLSNLEILDLSYLNKFEPSVSFSDLSSLKVLNLSSNHLNGTVPGFLFSMKKLTDLYLDHNQLSGSLPTPVGELNLKHVNVSWNRLSGKIPQQLDLSRNTYYDFSGNLDLCTSNPSHAQAQAPMCNKSRKHHKTMIILFPALVPVIVLLLLLCYTVKKTRLPLTRQFGNKKQKSDDYKLICFRTYEPSRMGMESL